MSRLSRGKAQLRAALAKREAAGPAKVISFSNFKQQKQP
jgi:hypothetical protein